MVVFPSTSLRLCISSSLLLPEPKKFDQIFKIAYSIASFLPYPGLCNYSATSKGAQKLRNYNEYQLDREQLSRIGIFDERRFKQEWKVEIVAQISNKGVRAFLNVYYGDPDPLGRPGKVRDYCLIPVVVPTKVRDIDSKGPFRDFDNDELDKLARRSTTYPAKLVFTEDLSKLLDKSQAAYARIVIKINRVVGRGGELPELMRAIHKLPPGWDALPNILSQNLALIGHHALTGKHYHGGDLGMELSRTEGVTSQTVQCWNTTYPVSSGFFNRILDGSFPSRLYIARQIYLHSGTCAGVQREFI